MILMSVDLPAPFSPEKGMNLAGVKGEGDVFERLGGVEPLGDAADLQDRRDDCRRSVGELLRARSCLSAPAGHVDDRARDIGGSIAQQPDDRLGDFIRGSGTPERS